MSLVLGAKNGASSGALIKEALSQWGGRFLLLNSLKVLNNSKYFSYREKSYVAESIFLNP
jgi:hypothetical protein